MAVEQHGSDLAPGAAPVRRFALGVEYDGSEFKAVREKSLAVGSKKK